MSSTSFPFYVATEKRNRDFVVRSRYKGICVFYGGRVFCTLLTRVHIYSFMSLFILSDIPGSNSFNASETILSDDLVFLSS